MERLRGLLGNEDKFLVSAFRKHGKCDAVLDKPASYTSVLVQFKVVVAGVSASPPASGIHYMWRGEVTSAVNNGAPKHAVQKQMLLGGPRCCSGGQGANQGAEMLLGEPRCCSGSRCAARGAEVLLGEPRCCSGS